MNAAPQISLGLDCPRCHQRTEVARVTKRLGTVVRVRRCPNCGHRCATEERPLTTAAGATKATVAGLA